MKQQLLLAPLLLAPILLATHASAQGPPKIYHETPLNWGHFQGGLPSDPTLDAETSTNFDAKSGFPTKPTPGGGAPGPADDVTACTKNASVKAYVDQAASTTRGGATQTPALLRHEQYHFDIAHIWARHYEAALDKLTATGPDKATAKANLQAKIAALDAQMTQACKAVDEAYDLFTNHSKNHTMQEIWCYLIGLWMDALNVWEQAMEALGTLLKEGGGDGNAAARIEVPGLQVDLSGGDADTPPLLAPLLMPALELRGFHMGDRALFGPVLDGSGNGVAEVVIPDPGGGEALFQGRIRTMIGVHTGVRYTAWLEEATFRDDVQDIAPALHAMEAALDSPLSGVPMIELVLSSPLDLLGGQFEQTSVAVSIGVAAAYEPADCNADGNVDDDDLPYFEALFYEQVPQLSPVAGDMDGNGVIDVADALLFWERLNQ